jgi:hypothetical protein
MNIYYNYLTHNLKNASPLVTQWAEANDVVMLDFDNCMFDQRFDEHILAFLKYTKENGQLLAIVECHPFFSTDELYLQRQYNIEKISHDLNLNYFFLTADYNLWLEDTNTNKTFHPDWYFRQRQWSIENNYKSYNFDKARHYNFSCGNKSNFRTEKIYNYIECYRRRRLDWFATIYNHPNAKISEKTSKEFAGLSKEQQQLWDTEIRHTIKEYENDVELPDIYFTNPHCVIFPVHTNSYCNLVMEHTMEVPVLSEKSYKPFIAGQIPIYLAATNAARSLSYLGFDLFYDFVDHTQYDTVTVNNSRIPENFTKRIDKVHELIDNLYTANITDFIHNPGTKQRLKFNQDYFYSDEIDKLCVRHLDKILDK